MEHLKRFFLVYTVVPLLVILALSSYYRFMILDDYLVSYEGECDPFTQHCFVDCEDEECTSEYFYTIIERPAVEIKALCGPDITDCEAANSCVVNSETCTITYCDTEDTEESCEALGQETDSNQNQS